MMDSTTATSLNTAGMPPVCRDEPIAGYGTVTVVEGFQPGVDRLLLDFHIRVGLPELSFNTRLEPGSTAVMGNGLLMVMLRGVTGVVLNDVELRILSGAEEWDQEGASNRLGPPPNVPLVESFNPAEEVVEITYQPELYDQLTVEVQDFADGSGATVLFNGTSVLAVRGAQGLEPADIVLIPRPARQS